MLEGRASALARRIGRSSSGAEVSMSEDFNRARSLSQEALEAMARYRIPPTPHNYVVWYTHLSGRNPDLSRTIEVLISNHQEFTDGTNDRLYQQYFAAAPDADDLVAASGRLDDVVADVLNHVGVAGKDAARYGEALVAFHAGVERDRAADLQEAIETVLRETHRMAERNRMLEIQLQTSSAQINGLRQDIEELRQAALLDPLTGVANRKSFDQRLREAVRDALETGAPLSLIMIDIDHFKRFNDTFGHQLGDEVLRLTARVLRERTKGRDMVARYGGEEFAVLLIDTPLSGAMIVAEQLRTGVAGKQIMRKGSRESLGGITMSLGVAQYAHGEPLAQLMGRADQALYHAKRMGRNRVASEVELQTCPGQGGERPRAAATPAAGR